MLRVAERISIDAPSKSSFKMKLTTPPTASAPYTADAPPVISSTRWIAAAGIMFVSTNIAALVGCARLPSISTRLRFGPRPRRLTNDPPIVLFAVCWTSVVVNCVMAGMNCGNWFRIVSTPIVLVAWNAASSIVVIGRWPSKSRRWMREPVTVISSSACRWRASLSCHAIRRHDS